MGVYSIYILMCLILSAIYDGEKERRGKTFFYSLMCLYLIMLAGLRHGVGGDTQYYMEEFEQLPGTLAEYGSYMQYMLNMYGQMPGWTFLNVACKQLFGSFYAVQLIEAAVVNITLFYVFHKYTKHIFLCILLYVVTAQFFNFNTEVMREGMAIGLCSVGMYGYIQGKKGQFYLLVAVSLLFHISAVAALIFPFIRLKEITWQTLAYAFVISLGLWGLSDLIISRLTETLTGDGGLIEKVLNYSNCKSNYPCHRIITICHYF